LVLSFGLDFPYPHPPYPDTGRGGRFIIKLMFKLAIDIENFLAVKRTKVRSNNNIVFIIAPNRAGKTQIMLFLYTFFWSLWREQKENKPVFSGINSKLKNVFLVKKLKELISWGTNYCRFSVKIGDKYEYLFYQDKKKDKLEKLGTEFSFPKEVNLSKSPIYISPAGLGDYYKGIWAIKKYYENWRLVSEATTDLLHDLFILASENIEPAEKNEKLISIFESMFQAKFYIKNERVYVQEKGRNYGIEKAASGLKSLAWLYLILKYNLLGEIIFIDEPEVNLHPEYINKLAEFIYKLSKNRKIFIATHSDYLLESFNKFIKSKNLTVDVWIGRLDKDGAIYEGITVDKDNLIDTTPLNEVYIKIVKELFGYDKEIEV